MGYNNSAREYNHEDGDDYYNDEYNHKDGGDYYNDGEDYILEDEEECGNNDGEDPFDFWRWTEDMHLALDHQIVCIHYLCPIYEQCILAKYFSFAHSWLYERSLDLLCVECQITLWFLSMMTYSECY